MGKLVSTNPAKGYEVVGEVEISTDKEIKEAVEKANKAKLGWKELGLKKRIEFLQSVHKEIAARKEKFANLITKEIGVPIISSQGIVDSNLKRFQWYIDNVEEALKDEITHKDKDSEHKIVYEPLGTVAVITPWNYPLGMAVWGIIPNLLVGNTVVFKISEECPLTGKLIEEAFNEKLPEGVFSEVYGAGEVGQKLTESNIDLIWFTGSSKTAKKLYKIAAEKFIRITIEAGGSNPCIVFEDADVSKIVPIVHPGRFRNCGQSCDAIKRLIVHESLFDEVVEELKKEIENNIFGDPSSPDTKIGSLVAKRQQELLDEQVKDAVKKGAKIIIGGKKPENLKGAYYEPTLLKNITKDMRVWKEEVFGPALPIMSFRTEEEAVELANDTIYGLGSRVFSKDKKRAERVASRIESGTVEINFGDRWLNCNPFGGYKQSGIGREHGDIGFQELCQIKVISKNL